MHRPLLAALLLLLAAAPVLHAQDAPVLSAPDVGAFIYEEGTERSQVMHLAHVLTDVYGPRLTGSPALAEAGRWALETMQGWGLTNAKAVPWEWGHVGWENERLAVHVLEPVRGPLVAVPLAWTPSTDGPQAGPLLHLVPPSGPTPEQMQALEDSLRSLVRGAVVLVGEPALHSGAGEAPPQRLDDEEVRARFQPHPEAPMPERTYTPPRPPEDGTLAPFQVAARIDSLLRADGALVRVNPAGMPHGLIRAFANRSYDPEAAPPTLVMRDEDFGRLARLVAAGYTPRLEVDIQNVVHPDAQTEHNYTAEIPGSEAPEQVVMLGGHLDAWHGATGATDNAAGSAIMMEAARILQAYFEATGTRPRRTIRVALWTGEEQGLLGSRAYVRDTFGTFEEKKPAWEDFVAYLNVDSGTGRLRGASVFGPPEAAEALHEILQPLDSLGVAGARATDSRGLGGTDHTSFNNAGLAGVGMAQDPIQYFSTTWHTNVDTYERLLEDDLQQAAIVVATAVYELATREERLPRFTEDEMPEPPPAWRR